MKLRVGLVGLGRQWESRHRSALRALSDRFEVRAVCEEIGLRASQVAQEFGAASVDGYRALVSRDDIDALLMLAPQWFGPLPVIAACDHGKAVYCARVFDLQSDMANLLRTRVECAGIAFMLELPRRLAPATLRLKELIVTHLGSPKLLYCHQRLSAPTQPIRARAGESPQDMSHDLVEMVDWCRYVVGQTPTSVVGLVHHGGDRILPADGKDSPAVRYHPDSVYEMLSLDFSTGGNVGTGAIAQISCAQYVTDGWREAINFRPPAALQVCCENGIAYVDLPASIVWYDEAGQHLESLESERPVGEQLLSKFYRDVTSLVRKSSSLEESYQALEIIEAARLSARDGRRIEV